MKFQRVLAFGSNGKGQLGIDHKDDVDMVTEAVFEPYSNVILNDKVTKIVGGGNHTLMLTENGKLYWAGDRHSKAFPRTGQNPAGINTDHFYEININDMVHTAQAGLEQPFQVHHVAATHEASIIVVQDLDFRTQVWSCGIGKKGELGQEIITDVDTPLLVDGFVSPGHCIVDLAASQFHVVAVLSNGEVWGWGAGRKGQLGAPFQDVILKPRKIDGVTFSVVRAACGTEFTILFGDDKTGEFVILGSDKDAIQSSAPCPALICNWKDVGASFGTIYVLTRSGDIVSWGRNNRKQQPPAGALPRIIKMAIGSEHVVALDTGGNVWAWGWGEHGNCGPLGNSANGTGPLFQADSHRLNLSAGGSITNIGAGWATSWVVVEEFVEEFVEFVKDEEFVKVEEFEQPLHPQHHIGV